MATINFISNQTVQGTSGSDLIDGNDTAGNNNDIVYGHQGDDTITFDVALNNSTLYGGQGNDRINADNGSALYGNFGNDYLFVAGRITLSILDVNDSLYGGQGDDTLEVQYSANDVLYGNLGNDLAFGSDVFAETAYGGQGQDTLLLSIAANSFLYGNQGNDILSDNFAYGFRAAVNGSGAAEGSSVLYGGQGDDTLSAPGAGGDTMFGGAGSDLFAGNDLLNANVFTVNDLITVGDFVSGQDRLSLSTSLNGMSAELIFLTKENDSAANNPSAALSAANTYYSTVFSGPEYLFIYGGAGAGYLFYNGDAGGTAANDGMILTGNNGENSLAATDIFASGYASGL